MFDIVIVGAGISGAMIARELSKYQLKVLVLEQTGDVGNKASMANSAIVHAGYDPLPGTLKAKLNVLGASMYEQVAQELDVTYKKTGSLTIAINDEQCQKINELFNRAKLNGVEVELLDKKATLEKEPNLTEEVIMSLFAPNSGIIDPFNLVVHAMENAIDNGIQLKLNHKITNISLDNEIFQIECENGSKFTSKIVINASGIDSASINEMVNSRDFEIKGRKGEYFVLDHFNDRFVNHVVFPLPSNKGKGILITPTTSGNYLVGPSSEFVEDKEDVSSDKKTLDDIKRQAEMLVKNIPFEQVIRVFSGLRATGSTGDFIIDMKTIGFINVAGIESPGLASAPALAKYVVEEFVAKLISLKNNEQFNPLVNRYTRPNDLLSNEKAKLINENSKYGKLVCFCEKVSEQEIIDVLHRSCPPHSIKGVKKRVRAGFGKCQGGMCQVTVAKILAKHYGIPLEDVPYDDLKTNISDLKGVTSNE